MPRSVRPALSDRRSKKARGRLAQPDALRSALGGKAVGALFGRPEDDVLIAAEQGEIGGKVRREEPRRLLP